MHKRSEAVVLVTDFGDEGFGLRLVGTDFFDIGRDRPESVRDDSNGLRRLHRFD